MHRSGTKLPHTKAFLENRLKSWSNRLKCVRMRSATISRNRYGLTGRAEQKWIQVGRSRGSHQRTAPATRVGSTFLCGWHYCRLLNYRLELGNGDVARRSRCGGFPGLRLRTGLACGRSCFLDWRWLSDRAFRARLGPRCRFPFRRHCRFLALDSLPAFALCCRHALAGGGADRSLPFCRLRCIRRCGIPTTRMPLLQLRSKIGDGLVYPGFLHLKANDGHLQHAR